jgi:hypothetical protein
MNDYSIVFIAGVLIGTMFGLLLGLHLFGRKEYENVDD